MTDRMHAWKETGVRASAFPNAYISTDEPPRRSALRRGLCLLAVSGVSYLGLVILALSLFTTAYSPVSQVASDYGVGAYAFWMNSGFLLAGLGVLSLGGVLATGDRGRTERTGGALLFVSGLALVLNSAFATDIEGSAQTFHGDVHALAGVLFFIAASLGVLLVSRGFGRSWFRSVSLGLVVAATFLALDGVLGLDASGLGERVAILVIFSSTILIAARVYRES